MSIFNPLVPAPIRIANAGRAVYNALSGGGSQQAGTNAGQYENIPPSLDNNIYTDCPFFIHLYGADTNQLGSGFTNLNRGWRGWTPDEVKKKANRVFRLPLPERGFGTSTELKATDEEKILGYPEWGPLIYKYSLGDDYENEFLGHGMGGSNVPLDFTAITVYGTKKRSFMLTFDLYSIDAVDSQAIGNFCYEMHGLSTIRPGYIWLGTPYIWTFEIWNRQDNVTNLWVPSPQACAMMNFYHSPSNFIHTHDEISSARMIVTMLFTEVEPIAYRTEDKKFMPSWY